MNLLSTARKLPYACLTCASPCQVWIPEPRAAIFNILLKVRLTRLISARLFLIDSASLVPKSFLQWKQRHLLVQALPCEKQGHLDLRCPGLSWQEVKVELLFFPSPHLQTLSLAATILLTHPMHLHPAAHFCSAATHGHRVDEQELTLVFWFLPQLRHLSFVFTAHRRYFSFYSNVCYEDE